MFSSSSSKQRRKSKYRSARAVRPPTHVVTEWTRLKLLVLLLGILSLGGIMLLPLVFLDLPSSPTTKSHVGLSSLLHKSGEIQQNWKHFLTKEKSLLQQELQQDLPQLFRPQGTPPPDDVQRTETVQTTPPNKKKQQPKTTTPNKKKQTQPKHPPNTNTNKKPSLGRGVAGLPRDLTPALIGAQPGHVQCDVNVDDLAYWNDPVGARDLQWKTPFSSLSTGSQFLSFEPDEGGWNNIRMSYETLVVLAAATGRTLILPPKAPFYLLAWGSKGARTFGSFFSQTELSNRISVITMAEFMKLHGQTVLGLTSDEVKELEPLAEMCLYKEGADNHCDILWQKFRPVGWQPKFQTGKDCLIFDEGMFQGKNTLPENVDKVTRFCGKGRTPWYYNSTWTEPQLLHWDAAGEGTGTFRLLNHFYTTMFFTNPATDNTIKRLVRDVLHYKDEIQCAAGKIVQAIKAEFPIMSSWHVRRGDFQYKATRLTIDEWYENTKDFLKEGEALYIATDENNKTFFDPLTEKYGHPVKFLQDYNDVVNLNDMDPTYLGMIDTIVASHGRTFTGTWFSTFSGYINRLRGYRGLSMKDSWYSWTERKTRLHTWDYPSGSYYAREWPIAWTGIDGDEWIEQETHEVNAESDLEKEAGLDDGSDGQEEEEEVEVVPVDRKVPKLTLDLLEQDVDWTKKPVARGVAGRPLDQTPAMEGAARAHVQCDVNVDSSAYWNDPQGQRDQDFKSPFAVEGAAEKYITFGIDRGGWNNVRMSMEIIFIIALVTGRTLVLPPEIKLYLLHHDSGHKTRSFADFFPLHTKEFAKRLKIMTMTEFIEKEGGPNGIVPLPLGKNATTIKHAADHCDNRQKSDRSCMTIMGFLESSGFNPGFRAIDDCVVFDADAYKEKDPSEASAQSAKHFCGKRDIFYWTETMNESPVIHFHGDDKYYRLLTHFYSMLHFTDTAIDNYVKRFVRDFLHYHDEIYCAAGKIVKALQYEAKLRGKFVDEEGGGGYSAMHVRRGDLQYKKVKLPARIWWNNTKELWKEDEILYIATDEKNISWFNPIARKRSVRFLSDYWDLAGLGDLDPNYIGMIDTIVASRGRAFAGTWFSTFTGYINRMRGYHGLSMFDSWYSFLPRKDALHNWTDVDHYAYASEWPAGWAGIDADVVPTKEKY